MKTPEQAAKASLDAVLGNAPSERMDALDHEDYAQLLNAFTRAIEADRAQRQAAIITTNEWHRVAASPAEVLEKLDGTVSETRTMTLYAVAHPAIPTFYLDANVQGILDKAGAVHIAKKVTAFDEIKPLHITRIDYQVPA